MEISEKELAKVKAEVEAHTRETVEKKYEDIKNGISERDGTIKGLEKKLEDALAHSTELETANKKLADRVNEVEKAEREAAIAEAHTVDPDYDPGEKSTEDIKSYTDGLKRVLEKHNVESHTQKLGGTRTPGPGDGGSLESPLAKKYGKDKGKIALHRMIFG